MIPTTRTIWSEVFLIEDGAALSLDNYNGIYIVEEKVKRVRSRAKVAEGMLFFVVVDLVLQGFVT